MLGIRIKIFNSKFLDYQIKYTVYHILTVAIAQINNHNKP